MSFTGATATINPLAPLRADAGAQPPVAERHPPANNPKTASPMTVHSAVSFPFDLLLAVVALGWSALVWRNVKRKNAKRRRAWEQNPPPPDEGLDENVLSQVSAALEKCGTRQPSGLPDELLPLAPKVKAFLETWSALDFDRGKEWKGESLEGVYFEYERKNLAVFKENPAFVELGGDGGEQSFYVKRDPSDETVYVLDLELDFDYTKPRPYASDIDRWIALRLQEHQYG